MYGTYVFAVTITFPVVHGAALIDSIEYISKTTYRTHLQPSSFNSDNQTPRELKFSFFGEIPMMYMYFLKCGSHWEQSLNAQER